MTMGERERSKCLIEVISLCHMNDKYDHYTTNLDKGQTRNEMTTLSKHPDKPDIRCAYYK